MQRWRKIYHANNNQKKAEVDKIDFRTRNIIAGLKVFRRIKKSIFHKDIIACNVYISKNSVRTPETKTNRIAKRSRQFMIVVGDPLQSAILSQCR